MRNQNFTESEVGLFRFQIGGHHTDREDIELEYKIIFKRNPNFQNEMDLLISFSNQIFTLVRYNLFLSNPGLFTNYKRISLLSWKTSNPQNLRRKTFINQTTKQLTEMYRTARRINKTPNEDKQKTINF